MTKIIVTLETLKALNRFVSKEETRYYLKGVYFDSTKKVLVATDSHQMLIAKPDQELPEFESFILPTEIIKKLKGGAKFRTAYVMIDTEKKELSVCDHAGIRPTQETWHDHFDAIGTRISYTPIDGTFPSYERVVPSAENYTCTIPDNGRAFDPELMGSLAGMTTQVVWFFPEDATAPARFRCNKSDHFDGLGVIMPMRTNEGNKDITPAWWDNDKGQEKAA